MAGTIDGRGVRGNYFLLIARKSKPVLSKENHKKCCITKDDNNDFPQKETIIFVEQSANFRINKPRRLFTVFFDPVTCDSFLSEAGSNREATENTTNGKIDDH